MEQKGDVQHEEDWRLPATGHRFLHELAKDRVAAISNAVDQLDSKIQALVTSGAALLGIALSVIALRDTPVPDTSWIFLAAGGACFVILLALGAWAYAPRDYKHGPSLDNAWEHACSGRYDEDTLHAWAADTYTTAAKTNTKVVRPKARAVSLSLVVLLAEFVELSTAIVIAL